MVRRIAAAVVMSLISACGSRSTTGDAGGDAQTDAPPRITTCETCPPGARACWFVTTDGTPTGDGSMTAPWDLETALDGADGRVQPGDIVWLRGGVYPGSYTASSNLVGSADSPIHVRGCPGERATIDGNSSTSETLDIDGSYVWFWDFEVTNTRTDRYCASCLGLRPSGIYVRVEADHIKLIDLIVHDTGHGVYTEYVAPDIELYGLVIFNGGNDNDTRSDGHGIYVKNLSAGVKSFRELVIFNQFGFGIHAYNDSASTGGLENMELVGNMMFNNGEPSNDDNPNFQIGGNVRSDQIEVTSNIGYFSPGHGGINFRIGYDTLLNASLQMAGNYIAGGSDPLVVNYWSNAAITNNTIVGPAQLVVFPEWPQNPMLTGYMWDQNRYHQDAGAAAWRYAGMPRTFAGWQSATGFDVNSVTVGAPVDAQVFVRPNAHEAGRAHIAVYNWSNAASVTVDLSSAGLRNGSHFEIHNVQALLCESPRALFCQPIMTGVFDEAKPTIELPMAGVTPPAPYGGSPQAPVQTGPAFDVFVLREQS